MILELAQLITGFQINRAATQSAARRPEPRMTVVRDGATLRKVAAQPAADTWTDF